MDSAHISKERLRALMFATVHLTEEEDAHLAGWRCAECTSAVLEVVMHHMSRQQEDSAE
jgi:hypothetical protein